MRGRWPDGKIHNNAPTATYWAAEIAKRLRIAVDGSSKSDVAAEAEIARSTLYDLLNGEAWPDVVTVVKLQDALGVELWPAWKPRSKPDK